MSENISVFKSSKKTGIIQFLGRLLTSAIILAITAFFTPGFSINSIWSLILATFVLTILDFVISKFTGIKNYAFGKGFLGFILCAICLYITQYVIAGYTISLISAFIGALIYGIVDFLLPGD